MDLPESDPVQAALASLRHAITTALSATDALALQLRPPTTTQQDAHTSPAGARDPAGTDLPGATLGIDNTDTALSVEDAGSQAPDSAVSRILGPSAGHQTDQEKQ